MAQKITTVLSDDINGTAADTTVSFSLDRVEYEIDLTNENAAKLRADLQQWIAKARRVGGRRRRGTGTGASNTTREMNRKVRAWAVQKGFQVSDRGPVPITLIEQYKQENPS